MTRTRRWQEMMTYTITVSNAGPSTATSVGHRRTPGTARHLRGEAGRGRRTTPCAVGTWRRASRQWTVVVRRRHGIIAHSKRDRAGRTDSQTWPQPRRPLRIAIGSDEEDALTTLVSQKSVSMTVTTSSVERDRCDGPDALRRPASRVSDTACRTTGNGHLFHRDACEERPERCPSRETLSLERDTTHTATARAGSEPVNNTATASTTGCRRLRYPSVERRAAPSGGGSRCR